ncbi:putative carboxylesterase [Fragilariopsis cylindrus CCMP1102]|uniref:Putative carboxylesterase n=1 Tax=Fragilariopsis cylindrus CCMP1102 TaxID=635003 RepID=A0A1E7EYD9_9STRA|nr:putative carboxylesterase [Fragilariopsis cylindrus CCMP1102]|eukprot:OEU10846.1 putative carboxylesterase [Fragilariopsis cylindrus CCMP1102]
MQSKRKVRKAERISKKAATASAKASSSPKAIAKVTGTSLSTIFLSLLLFLTILSHNATTTCCYAQQQNQNQNQQYESSPFYSSSSSSSSGSGSSSSTNSNSNSNSDSAIPVRATLKGLGIVQGTRTHNLGVDFFGGIPYAAPPVGSLRFAPPQEPPKWSPQILDSSNYGTDCYQIVDPIMNPFADPNKMSEDCLYLNIFTPAGAAAASETTTTPSQLLPVMVWLHGGAFQQGSGDRPEYNARRLAQEERVVVVTVNYRLGALGFLVSNELGLNGNYGLMDQRAALHFVKRRIESFGGNPNSITLFGESAGAVMIGLHLQMQNDGLFHKAILQSNPMGYQFRSVVVADFLGDALRRTVDCRDLECMRTEAVEEIMRAQSSLMGIPRSVGDFFAWGPTLTTSGSHTTQQVPMFAPSSAPSSSSSSSNSRSRSNYRRESKTKFAVNVTQPLHNLNLVPDHIPIIIGTNKHEGELFVHGAFPLTMSKTVYWMFVGALFKDSAPRVLKHYRPYVAQLEADAAALAEKQVSEEMKKQYFLENQQELEEEYRTLLHTSTTTRGGSTSGENVTENKSQKEDTEKEGNGDEDFKRWWHAFTPSADPEQVKSRQQQRLDNMKRKAKERALREAAKISLDYRPVMSRIITDYLFRCPSWMYAHQLNNRNNNQDNRNNVYVYRFSQPTHIPGFPECWGKSCHTAELPYVFESMDIIRSDYSTLSSIAQKEAPVAPEYPYTDLIHSYQGVLHDDDDGDDEDEENENDDSGCEQQKPTGSCSSSSFPLPNQLSNYTSRFQQILRHMFGDYFLEDSDEETAHDMAQRWVAFARSGNPNHEESNIEWIPWRYIPHSIDLNNVDEENLRWEKDERKLFNIWRDVDLEEDDGISNEDEDLLESNVDQAFRKRALEVLNMEVVEDDSLRTELKRNKPPSSSINGDSPLSALRLYLSRWNITTGGSSSSDENSNINGNYDMIQQIQQMAQDMGVLGRGLSGDYDRPGGLPFGDFGGGIGGSSSSSRSSHGYWDDDFFPQFIELQWPPEGRLVERDCTCDFWERIRCKCLYAFTTCFVTIFILEYFCLFVLLSHRLYILLRSYSLPPKNTIS